MIRVAALVVLATRLAQAEPATVELAAQVQFGVTTAPFDVTTLPVAKGQALVFTLEGAYALAPKRSLGVRAPGVLASIAQPGGSYVDSATIGNPQLWAAVRWLDRAKVAVDGGVELGVPLAGRSPSLLSNRALAIANGISGLAMPERFTPGVVPVTAFAVGSWSSAPWRIAATVRIPFLLRFSDADLDTETATPRSVGVASVVGAEVRRQLTHRLALAAAAQLALDLAPSVEHVRSNSRVQDLARLELGIQLGSCSSLAIDVQSAFGGELGGSTLALGVRYAVNK